MSKPALRERIAEILQHHQDGELPGVRLDDALLALVMAAVEAEREACARVVESCWGEWDWKNDLVSPVLGDYAGDVFIADPAKIAAAIRERGR